MPKQEGYCMKRALALMAALVMAFAMAGCAGGASPAAQTPSSNTAAQTQAPAAAEPISIVVWESEGGPDQWLQQAAAKYKESHPNVTVEYKHVELGDTSTQIALDGPAGVGADLFAVPHDKIGELVTNGHVLAVDLKADVLEGCLKAATYDGKVYGYPQSTETYALFYNKDLCPEPPKTWEELISFGKEFNAANPGKYAFVIDPGNGYYEVLFASAKGNTLFGPSGTDTANTYLNTADALVGVKIFSSLKSEILPVAAADLATSTVDGLFQGGQAAMHITGPWNFKNFKDAGINFGVTTLPALPGESTPALSFSGTRLLCVSAYTDHPAEVSEFAEFLLSSEIQSLRYDITGALPSVSVQLGGEYGEYATGLLGQMDYAYPMPSIPQMGKFWDSANSAFANIWDGADPQAEMDSLNTVIISE
jgi:arabinogalactan oligomer/maltooligosaccharide transport system substrate-binding protein